MQFRIGRYSDVKQGDNYYFQYAGLELRFNEYTDIDCDLRGIVRTGASSS